MGIQKTLMLLAATTCLASPVFAQQSQVVQVAIDPSAAIGEENVEERIRTSVRIKMRSQSISAAVCHLQAGMNASDLNTPLDQQVAEFEQFVTALTAGDASLNIVRPEGRKKTLQAAGLITDAWGPVKVAAMNIASGSNQASDTDFILDHNAEILEHGHNFTAELVKQYANPVKATFADLLTIVVASRQGMLSQKISKEACMALEGDATAAQKLGETMMVYENTMFALRDGMPAAGIEAAPTKEITAGLTEAVDLWAEVKPILTKVAAGETITPEEHVAKMKMLDGNMYKMLEVSSLYVDFTKSKHN